TVERVAEEPITEEEVARAKAKLLKQRELVANDSGRIAIELSDWAAMGDWRLFFLYRDRLEAVTVEDVNAAAAKYLQRENRTAGVFLPTKAPVSVPVAPTLDIAEQVDGYTGREVADLGEAFDVAPANVESRLTRTKAGDGDFDLLLLPKQNRGSTVSARVVLRYGNAEDLSGLATACEMLPRLMLRGTSTKTREQIQDELDRLQARLTGSGSAGAAAFAIKAKRETLPAVLDLLTEIVTDATLPADELEIMRKAELATLKARLVDPQALAPNAVRRRLSPWPSDDPRYVPTLEEEVARVESVTRDQLLRLKEEFLNGDAGAATFVGTFDVDDATKRVETLLASLDGPVPYRRLGDRAPETLAAESLEINTPDKKNAVYFNATAFALSDTDADYPAVLLGNFILGGGSLSSRLGDRVRQQEGLSYGVGSGFSAQALDERAAFYIYAISNPENVPRLKQVVREELDRYLTEGPTDEEVEQARGGYLQQLAVERSDDGELARVLSATARDGRTMAFYETLEGALGGLTAEEVRAAFARYIDVDRLVLAVAGDFGKDD
ncbi:MAG: insulinase family protein, partial [Planctomycetota bacterium]